ncbi:MAG: glycoside hydrolase, partial [Spirochaetaceae bacterium]|nr:glycoside hydrolase [Spirochaetaceae bacterium]
MKSSKTLFLFGGLVALLALGGTACFNPNSPVSAPTRESDTDTAATAFNDIEPFTVSFSVNGDGSSRSIAGLPRDQLKAETGVRNFAQLIVLDTAGKKLMGFAETTESGTITINALPLGKTYAFLLLMGRKDGGSPPTLLNVGLTQSTLNTEGSTNINIMMYPVVVQTAFSNNAQTIEPVIEAGKPKPVYLPPGDWKVKWTIQRTDAGTDGLDRLRAAQAIIDETEYDLGLDQNGGTNLKIRGLTYKKDGVAVSPAPAVTAISNGIEWDISAYTGNGNIWNSGAVNFNVEYVPFNLTDWKIAYNGQAVQTVCTSGIRWIIRNGVNDAAPDGNTNFAAFGKTDANANGAVAFIVGLDSGTAVPENPDDSPLKITDGTFDGGGGTSPTIGFTTGGYAAGKAQVYYATVSSGAGAPAALSGSTGYLGEFAAAAHTGRVISLTAEDDDVYLLAVKDGVVSAPHLISRWTVDETLIIKDGALSWSQPALPQRNIRFTTAYTGDANVYYAIVSAGADAPSTYTGNLGTFSAGTYSDKKITLPGEGTGVYDIYMVIRRNGRASAPVKINTGFTGRFVGSTGKESIFWSDDGGETWIETKVSSGGASTRVEGIAYDGKGTLVAVLGLTSSGSYPADQYGGNKVLWSDDGGESWNQANLPRNAALQRVAYGNGKFVALPQGGRNYVYYSADGKNWSSSTLPVSNVYWSDMVFGNGMFVAVPYYEDDLTYDSVKNFVLFQKYVYST